MNNTYSHSLIKEHYYLSVMHVGGEILDLNPSRLIPVDSWNPGQRLKRCETIDRPSPIPEYSHRTTDSISNSTAYSTTGALPPKYAPSCLNHAQPILTKNPGDMTRKTSKLPVNPSKCMHCSIDIYNSCFVTINYN